VPLFFFDVYNDDVTLDDEGVELLDGEAAMARAIKETRILAAETVRQGHLTCHHRLEVRDEQRRNIGSVRFDEAVEIRS
jgi:hypothetical protein